MGTCSDIYSEDIFMIQSESVPPSPDQWQDIIDKIHFMEKRTHFAWLK